MNVFKSNSHIIKNKNILKYELYTNTSKNIYDYRSSGSFQVPGRLFTIDKYQLEQAVQYNYRLCGYLERNPK